MISNRYKISCSKFVWSAETGLSDVNIFSSVKPVSTEVINDLKPYMIDVSDITWDLDTTDEEDGKSNLFFEESDVTYELSGIVNNSYLIDFFGLYRDTTREKYLIQILDEKNGSFIHRGIVSQELIEITYSPAVDSEVIKITAMGYLKEFKAYYSGINLVEGGFNWSTEENLPNVIHNSGGHRTRGCSMQSLLQQNFSGGVTTINFILEPDVAEWFIIENPCLSKRQNYSGLRPDNTCWIKSSYERIRTNQEKRFDFIRRLCNAMGWIFYYSDNNFYIKNRSPIETPAVLDFNNVIEYTLTKQKEESQYESVIILDGATGQGDGTGGGQLRGARFQYFGSHDSTPFGRWWTHIDYNGCLLHYHTAHWRMMRYYNENDNEWNYKITEFPLEGCSQNGMASNQISLSKKTMLRIDGGDTGEHGWGYDIVNKVSFEREFSYEGGDYEVKFKGNYGNAMFKIDNNNQVYTYEDYVQSAVFRNNFVKFFRNNLARRVKLKYKGIIVNPLQKYTFVNAREKFAGEWVTTSLKVDLKNEVSTIDLLLKEN